MKLIPKNWNTFQHYKDRCPPWIKLHRDILTNYEFSILPLEAKAVAPLLWLLAAESKDGEIDLSLDALSFRLHIASNTLASAIKSLIDNGFFIDASNTLADCYQVAIPETERETETEAKRETKREAKTDSAKAQNSKFLLEEIGVTGHLADDFIAFRKSKKAPISKTVIDGIFSESQKAGMSPNEFVAAWIQSGWQGFKADWLINKSQPISKSDMTRQAMRNFLGEEF